MCDRFSDPKFIDLSIRVAEILVCNRQSHVAIELIEELTMRDSAGDCAVIQEVKHSMFLASLYVMCNMEPYYALKELSEARERLKRYFVKKSIVANRLRKRARSEVVDIGDLDKLPDICLEAIAKYI